MKIAVTSSDGVNVDLHLGKGSSVYIYDSSDNFNLIEHRSIDININEKHQGSKVINALLDCKAIISEEFGFKSKVNAESKGIILYHGHGLIKDSLEEFINWYDVTQK